MSGSVLRIITRLNRGGPLRQLSALMPRLPALGWDGPLIAGRVERHESDGAEELEGVGIRPLRMRALRRGIDPAADILAFRAILAAIRRFRPDVVHTHLGKAGALGRLAARIAGVPTVHTYHGHHLESSPLQAGLARFVERALGRATTAGVCLSPRQCRDLVDVHRVLPGARANRIAPGMDVEAFRRRAATALPLPQPEASARFVWTGRFVAVKDPLRLIEATALSRTDFHVTMLGRGPLLERARAVVRTHGLQARVACPGSVRDVAPWVARSDGLVLCSKSEGMPLSAIEGMVLGKPVVATTVGGLPDLVTHEGTGLWVPPGDAVALAAALDRLAADGALRERLGRAGAAEASTRFAAGRLARETAALYERVVRGV